MLVYAATLNVSQAWRVYPVPLGLTMSAELVPKFVFA
jgi:hypothetical protein